MRLLRYVWAFPATAIGLPFVVAAWLSGGRTRAVEGVLEVEGGLVSAFLRKGLPVLGSASAMTLGHVVLGCDRSCLERTRRHERVHVRQYERFGPFMLPLYLTASMVLYLRGMNPYLDNPFEREAFAETEG